MKKASKRSLKGVQSFQDTMSQMTLAKLAPFIQEQVLVETRRAAGEQLNLMQSLITRLLVLEQLAVDKLGVTKDDLSELVADKEDEAMNYEKVDKAEKGDKVRVTIATKTGDEAYGAEAKYTLAELGKDLAIGQIEEALTGKSKKDVVEVKMSEDKDGVITMMKLKVDRVSRKRKEVVANENA